MPISCMLFLTALYWPLLKYLSAGERDRLEQEFNEKARRQPELYTGAREAFVRKRLQAYEKRLHRKLAVWVYALPLALACPELVWAHCNAT